MGLGEGYSTDRIRDNEYAYAEGKEDGEENTKRSIVHFYDSFVTQEPNIVRIVVRAQLSTA
jgi:hypothetical protein